MAGESVIFIGGCMRSGTTLVQRILCAGKGAHPHLHSGIEQVCYLLEGSAHVEIGGESFEMQPGEACFFSAGMTHVFTVTSARARVLVIYSPPYLERPG